MASERAPRRRSLVYVVLASAVVMGGTGVGTAYVKAQAHADVGRVSSAAAAPVAAGASEEASVEPVADPTVEPTPTVAADTLLSDAMKPVTAAAEDGAEVSVAVLDIASGDSATYGDGTFDTASIVKVDILAALLLQAQDEGRSLTAQEKRYATSMIEVSDNASASALWTAIGKAEGLAVANKRFGLTGHRGRHGHAVGPDPDHGGRSTHPAPAGVRGEGRRRGGLAAQRGVPDVSPGPDGLDSRGPGLGSVGRGFRGATSTADRRFALKNGWLPRTATGLWDINSIGRVTAADGREFLVAVVSNGNTTKAKGISLVESAARAAVSVFTAESGATSSTGTTDQS